MSDYGKYLKYKSKYLGLKQSGGNDTKSLFERLGGIYAIAAVVDYFSDRILESALVGRNSKNPDLHNWALKQDERLPGLKWMRTLWVAEVSGGPYKYVASETDRIGSCHLALDQAHHHLHISPDEFDEVAKILKESLIHFNVPQREQDEVLNAFAAHKVDVTKGYFDQHNQVVDLSSVCK